MMIYLFLITLLIITLLIALKGPAWLRVLSVILLSLMIFIGAQFLTSVNLHRYYHSTMNVGIGYPYTKLVGYLYNLNQQKDYDRLGKTIEKMKNQPQDISDVWLSEETLSFHNFVENVISESSGDTTLNSRQTQ